MKTVYFTTNQYVRREGNVIDLAEYKNRLRRADQAAAGDGVSFHWETDESVWHCDEPEEEVRACAVPRRERKRRYSLAEVLELCASAGALVLVITVWLQFLL